MTQQTIIHTMFLASIFFIHSSMLAAGRKPPGKLPVRRSLMAQIREAENEIEKAHADEVAAEKAVQKARDKGRPLGPKSPEITAFQEALDESEKRIRHLRDLKKEAGNGDYESEEEDESDDESDVEEVEEVITIKKSTQQKSPKKGILKKVETITTRKKATKEEFNVIDWAKEHTIIATVAGAGIVITTGLIIDLMVRGKDSVLYKIYQCIVGNDQPIKSLIQDIGTTTGENIETGGRKIQEVSK